MKKIAVVLLVCLMAPAIVFAGGAGDKDSGEFPSRPIRLIVPWSAGGGTDAIARALAQTGEKHLGVPVIVENKPGGIGAVGLSETVTASPDGYTLAILPVELGFAKQMRTYPFDFSNFTRIMNLNTDPAALAVRADAPWNTLQEFVNYARANPERINVAHSGTGNIWHLAGLALAVEAGVQFTYVPFDGAGDAIAAILGGHVQAMTFSGAEVSAQVRAGSMKILAVFNDQRMDIFPNVPTAKEQGFNVVISTFRGLGGPAGIPANRVQILHDAFKAMMQEEVFVGIMSNMGLGTDYRNSQEYQKLTDDTARILSPLVRIAVEEK